MAYLSHKASFHSNEWIAPSNPGIKHGLLPGAMCHPNTGRPRLFTVAKKLWSEKGIFARMLLELADQGGGTETLMIDATHLNTHRIAISMRLKKGGRGRLI